MKKHPAGNFCTTECVIEYATNKTKKNKMAMISKVYGSGSGRKLKTARTLKDERDTRLKAVKKACHDYIRARDIGKPCICCGEPLGTDYHAGHFLESGNYPLTRYHEDNINGQKISCNSFKGGDSGMYRVNLVEKIGFKRVEFLESLKGKVIKRTNDDLKEIEDYYKAKLKALN